MIQIWLLASFLSLPQIAFAVGGSSDLYPPVNHPLHWDKKGGHFLAQNLAGYLAEVCSSNSNSNPTPAVEGGCQLPGWIFEYLALDELFSDPVRFQLAFEKGVNLRDIVTVNFSYNLVEEPKVGAPFESLARFTILKKLISRNLPLVSDLVRQMISRDGRQTWTFDSVIFPRLNVFFGGETMVAKLASFSRGLTCDQPAIKIPQCEYLKTTYGAALTLLRQTIVRSRWEEELRNVNESLKNAEAKDQLRFSWNKIRTDLYSFISTMPLDLSQVQVLGSKFEEIFYKYPNENFGFADIKFAQAAYDYLEITEALANGLEVPSTTDVQAPPELDELIQESMNEIQNITQTLQTALDYSSEL